MNDIALTGIPRGGTTLACRLLAQCAGTLALAEPMRMDALPTRRDAAVDAVAAFFGDVRRQVREHGRAPAKLVEGGIGDNFFGEADRRGHRPLVAREGHVAFRAPPGGYTLAIKHNAGFLALLPELARRMPLVALVRHPLPVLASWQSVDLPVRDGHVPAGERFDAVLRARLQGIPDALSRQLVVLDWCFARIADGVPRGSVVTYEAMIASGGQRLYDACGIAGMARPLENRNASAHYRDRQPTRLAAALAEFGGSWSHFYDGADDAEALAHLQVTP